MREEAAQDAERTRAEAVQRAQAHVAAVAQAATVLLGRVESMDGEVAVLVQSLQAGAGRLAGDLAAVETNMGELYDAASARALPAVPPTPGVPRSPMPSAAAPPPAPSPPAPAAPVSAPQPVAPRPAAPTPPAAPAPPPPPVAAPEPAVAPIVAARPPAPDPPPPVAPAPTVAEPAAAPAGDLDGARLVALNMALNGESREQAGRYLQENFDLADRERLLDEVYAAIEV